MKSIRSAVSFLYKLSTTAALGDGIGLVRQNSEDADDGLLCL